MQTAWSSDRLESWIAHQQVLSARILSVFKEVIQSLWQSVTLAPAVRRNPLISPTSLTRGKPELLGMIYLNILWEGLTSSGFQQLFQA